MNHVTLTISRRGRQSSVSLLWPTGRVRAVNVSGSVEDRLEAIRRDPDDVADLLGISSQALLAALRGMELVTEGWGDQGGELPPAA